MNKDMANEVFNAQAYFAELTQKNKLCRVYGFTPAVCSGPGTIEGVVARFRTNGYFVMVDDTADANTSSSGAGYYKRRVYTVNILAQYKLDDMADREKKLDVCREVFRQFHSKMLKDAYEQADDRLTFLDVQKVYSKEYGRYSFSGLTGLFFIISNNEPQNLVYDPAEWE